ncbi:MAG: DALR anticodon-binding domain-containing protein, partial [Bacillota bacterium]
STNNPVYYVQYAHARIHSIIDNSELEAKAENLDLLTHESEIALMKILAKFPEEIKMSAESRQPHHLTTYAYDLATEFHSFYNNCRVNTDSKELAEARLYLVNAARQVLKNVLTVLGISAPEQM